MKQDQPMTELKPCADASRVLRKLRDALEEAKEYIENLQLPDKEWSRILDLVVAALRDAK